MSSKKLNRPEVLIRVLEHQLIQAQAAEQLELGLTGELRSFNHLSSNGAEPTNPNGGIRR